MEKLTARAHTRCARVLLAVALLCAASGTACAQTYPSKPIKLVIPYPPGGSTDVIGRLVAMRLSDALGQSVVVDNRGGAGGVIGADFVAKSAADGYTILIGTPGAITISPSLQPKLPYQPLRDFAPVSLLATVPNLLVSHPSVPITGVQDLIRIAKAKPGLLSYGTSGIGASPHLAGELFKYMTQTDIVHVPYKGAGPAFLDLISGRIDLMFPVYASVLPQVNAKKVKAIAITSLQRAPALPLVPTVDESGLKGFEVSNWFGVLAPAGTPKNAVDRLNAAIVSAFKARETIDFLATQGLDSATSTPDQLLAYMRDEITKWGRVVKAANIKAE
ncbi:MAG: tripartite tricarboxylate transporter substrate binding protein [Betaproteobacteria bacterium]|nr:tripartite tricarboxylate transporter substrate binding protein [Betaproteobacteria bacterium]